VGEEKVRVLGVLYEKRIRVGEYDAGSFRGRWISATMLSRGRQQLRQKRGGNGVVICPQAAFRHGWGDKVTVCEESASSLPALASMVYRAIAMPTAVGIAQKHATYYQNYTYANLLRIVSRSDSPFFPGNLGKLAILMPKANTLVA
jgi:hypothetical protein